MISGCSTNGGGSGSGGGTGSTKTYPDSTGNWVVQATATSGTAPFTLLSGYINEQQTGTSHPTTGTFLPASTGCYAAAANVPMNGVIQGVRLHLVSFGLDQQVLDISAAKDDTSTHFTGTYSVTGGCADGTAGTVAGTRYSALTGTYRGSLSADPATVVTLTLNQFALGTGEAKFLVSGFAVVAGQTCFTTGTLSTANGSVIGNHVQMSFLNSNGPKMDVTGEFDAEATTISVSGLLFTGAGCPTNVAQATLTKV
ncbi:hypothetical protein [Terriglobus roseus]|uniref:hypothetical protein n=1 Tax=Terriglobus roseus TaxID=392734 RepID=UPI0012F6F46D|nr:hypothetical protein [Terriglobus roseus]